MGGKGVMSGRAGGVGGGYPAGKMLMNEARYLTPLPAVLIQQCSYC